jgi:hypothetical protein
MLWHRVSDFWHITGPQCLYCEGFRSSSTCLLMVNALQCFETSGTTNPPTWCHIPDDMYAVKHCFGTKNFIMWLCLRASVHTITLLYPCAVCVQCIWQCAPCFFMFGWACILKCVCNETNLMHYLFSVYWVAILLHVSDLLVAHHQEVAMYICDIWWVLYVFNRLLVGLDPGPPTVN